MIRSSTRKVESSFPNARVRKREWIVFGAYTALVIALSFYHEMWRDEVRAFSFATSAASWAEMIQGLPHEGHPIVWYAILRIGFALTHSNLVLPIASLLIGIACAWLILRFAPFPFWLRTLAVLGAFLGYELSVSARNYGIGVLFLLLSCIAFQNRAKRPLLLALPLALLANTSVHGMIVAFMILLYWSFDALDAANRSAIMSPASIAAFLLVIGGAAFAFITARPTPDMPWALNRSLELDGILRSILIDPGKGLLGFRDANIAATGEYPWRMTPFRPDVASRILVNAALIWLAFSMRKNLRALAVIVVAILTFEIFFKHVYLGSLRHEGVVLFLILALCWIEVVTRPREIRETTGRRLAIGLLPLFAMQSLALPVLVNRTVKYPESSSRSYGEFIRSNPRYRNAILAGEPDYMMEALPYYVKNRIFMPRQRELTHSVYFDNGTRRQNVLTLTELARVSDSVACAERVPVLLAIALPRPSDRPGEAAVAYRAVFRWTDPEWADFRASFPTVAEFPRATSDEVYRVYEVDPTKACARRPPAM